MRKKIFPGAKGFSLIELLISMAIIAVLLGLVGFGIAVAQRNSRDSQRRQKVSDIKLALEDYLTRKNAYPSADKFSYDKANEIIKIDTGGSNAIEIEVKGASTPAAGDKTESGKTRYCYDKSSSGDGYLLGALLENKEWFDQSSTVEGQDKCDSVEDNNPFKNSGI
jgi:prepilin-type N-terminal cleavage/methylation domain-containing protein